mgnify:CR=1 FL=1
MELYKTFSKLPLDRYEDYLSMIRNGDYRNIQADDVINKIYDDVDLDCFTKYEEELAEERLADYYYEI